MGGFNSEVKGHAISQTRIFPSGQCNFLSENHRKRGFCKRKLEESCSSGQGSARQFGPGQEGPGGQDGWVSPGVCKQMLQCVHDDKITSWCISQNVSPLPSGPGRILPHWEDKIRHNFTLCQHEPQLNATQSCIESCRGTKYASWQNMNLYCLFHKWKYWINVKNP